MNKYRHIFAVFVLALVVVPSVTFASWWNPFSWFKKKVQLSPIVQIQSQVEVQTKTPQSDQSTAAVDQTKKPVDSEILNPKPITVANVTGKTTAQCLKEKGAVFYGTFWCPHCLTQKSIFKTTASDLPYVECSTADKTDQTRICKNKNIMAYPTWEFANGERFEGELSLIQLAEKTGCPINVSGGGDALGFSVGASTQLCYEYSAPRIEILGPVANSVYTTGDVMAIRWASCNVPASANVQIMLGRGHQADPISPIAIAVADTLNDGSFDFNIPIDYDSTFSGDVWGLYLSAENAGTTNTIPVSFDIQTPPKIEPVLETKKGY